MNSQSEKEQEKPAGEALTSLPDKQGLLRYYVQQVLEVIRIYQNSLSLQSDNQFCLSGSFSSNISKINEANVYKFFMEKSQTEFEKIIIIYALLSSKTTRQLSQQISSAMQYNCIEEAQEFFKGIIENQLDAKPLKPFIQEIQQTIVPAIITATTKPLAKAKQNYRLTRKQLEYLNRKLGLMPRYPEIRISKDHEFFIAVCKLEGNPHSFITVGVHDKNEHTNHILCAVGKVCSSEKSSSLTAVGNYLLDYFKGTPSVEAFDEHYLYESKKRKISYKAFAITYKNYQELLALLGEYNFKQRGELKAFQLDQKQTSTDHEWQHYFFKKISIVPNQSFEEFNDKYHVLQDSFHSFKPSNNCRHTAITLLDTLLGADNQNRNISANFTKKLPYQTTIKKGKFEDNLFILPLPPKKLGNEVINKILVRIYKQLEDVPNKYRTKDETYKKFFELTNLYLSINTHDQMDIIGIFNLIKDWGDTNSKLIDTKRGFSLWFKTSTRNMLNELDCMQRNYNQDNDSSKLR